MADSPDRITWLLDELASGDPDIEVMWELPAAVYAAIHPLCLSLVDGLDAAYGAEQETWRRLLEHIANDPDDPEIDNGTDLVQRIARDVCRDLGQTEGDARSPRVLHDLAGLSDEEQAVLGLRQAGRSYHQIARTLGRGLTGADAQARHERALHQLRGRVHVGVWLREGWSVAACPELARFEAETRDLIMAGKPVTPTLCRGIGQHLDPRGLCQLCQPERERSELAYQWLIATLPPVLAGTAATAATKRAQRRLVRNIGITAAAVVLAVALVVLIIPRPEPVVRQSLPNPCDLLSQGDVALAMGKPVLPCASTTSIYLPLVPAGGPRQSAQATYPSANSVGDAVTIAVDSLGADSHAGFAEMCQKMQESGRQSDPNATSGSVPGVGDESCYLKSRITEVRRDVAVVWFAARRGAIVVTVMVVWTQRHDLPTGLVKLALSRIP